MKHGVRLQVAVYDQLVVDVIVESKFEAECTFSRWTTQRMRRDKVGGGAVISRADIRTWDVPVGGRIPQS